MWHFVTAKGFQRHKLDDWRRWEILFTLLFSCLRLACHDWQESPQFVICSKIISSSVLRSRTLEKDKRFHSQRPNRDRQQAANIIVVSRAFLTKTNYAQHQAKQKQIILMSFKNRFMFVVSQFFFQTTTKRICWGPPNLNGLLVVTIMVDLGALRLWKSYMDLGHLTHQRALFQKLRS